MPIPQFSRLVQTLASRNLTGDDELDAWLADIAKEKLGAGERADKARVWLSSVGRKYMKRHGQATPISPAKAESLARMHPWAAKAVASGASIQALALPPAEAAELKSILDWMRSEQGPALASDWSRVSWPQAHVGHEKWIEQIGRQAQRHLDESKAFDGCERSIEVDSPELDGWCWARPLTAQALDREGALMRHCVGSYAESVQNDALQIWSLREPNGHPRLTVETRPVAGGVEIAQVKSFANAPPRAEHALAMPSLFAHLKAIGMPAVAGSLDLWRAGIVVTPPVLGPPLLWRRGSADDASAAREKFVLVAESASEVEIKQMAKIFGILQYPAAMRELAAEAIRRGFAGPELAEIKIHAAKTGILLGSPAGLSGMPIDRASTADERACQEACHKALGMNDPDAREAAVLELAVFFADNGLRSPMEILAPALVGEMRLPNSARILAEINQRLLLDPEPSFLGLPPLAGRALWTSSPSLAEEALAAARSISLSAPISDGLKSLSLFCQLGHAEATRALALFIPLGTAAGGQLRAAALDVGAEIQRSGFSLAIDPFGQARIWTPMADDARDALVLALAQPDCGNPILPIAIKLGYVQAAAAISSNLSDAEATAISLSLISEQIDAASFGIRPSSSRSELELLREASLFHGFPQGALAALDALACLPDQSFDGPKHAKEMRESYPARRRIVADIHAAVEEVSLNPSLFRNLATRGTGPECGDLTLLRASPAWEALASRISEIHPDHLGVFSSCVKSMLARSAPFFAEPNARLRRSSPADAVEPELLSSARTALFTFLAQRLSREQASSLDLSLGSLPSVKFKLSERRVGSGRAPPLSTDYRPSGTSLSV